MAKGSGGGGRVPKVDTRSRVEGKMSSDRASLLADEVDALEGTSQISKTMGKMAIEDVQQGYGRKLVVIRDPSGRLAAISSFEKVGDQLYINHFGSFSPGYGLQALAAITHEGVKVGVGKLSLTSTLEARKHYERLGFERGENFDRRGMYFMPIEKAVARWGRG